MPEAQRAARRSAKQAAAGGFEENPELEDPDREYKDAQSEEDRDAEGKGSGAKQKRKPGRPKGSKAKPKKLENEKKDEPKAKVENSTSKPALEAQCPKKRGKSEVEPQVAAKSKPAKTRKVEVSEAATGSAGNEAQKRKSETQEPQGQKCKEAGFYIRSSRCDPHDHYGAFCCNIRYHMLASILSLSILSLTFVSIV